MRGKFLYSGEEKLYVRGVTYGTFRFNGDNGENPDPAIVERDLREMAASGVKMDARRTWLENEIDRLEMVERELQASLRAFLLASLELVEDREATRTAPVVEVPLSNPMTSDPATA